MTIYVAIVAIVNLALGYALAKMLGAKPEPVSTNTGGAVEEGRFRSRNRSRN